MYIYDIKPPKKDRCKHCGIQIKGWRYSLNNGVYCKNCYEIGLLIQETTLLFKEWRKDISSLNQINL